MSGGGDNFTMQTFVCHHCRMVFHRLWPSPLHYCSMNCSVQETKKRERVERERVKLLSPPKKKGLRRFF